MAAGIAQCSTTPRKRRPRAAGEVFITSESFVYLSEPKATTGVDASQEAIIDEPVYQNAPIPAARLKRIQRRGHLSCGFSSCRISVPENVGLLESDIDELESPPQRPVHGFETQHVAVFIGELICETSIGKMTFAYQ